MTNINTIQGRPKRTKHVSICAMRFVRLRILVVELLDVERPNYTGAPM